MVVVAVLKESPAVLLVTQVSYQAHGNTFHSGMEKTWKIGLG